MLKNGYITYLSHLIPLAAWEINIIISYFTDEETGSEKIGHWTCDFEHSHQAKNWQRWATKVYSSPGSFFSSCIFQIVVFILYITLYPAFSLNITSYKYVLQ